MPLPGVLRKGEERMRSKLSTVSAAILAAVLVAGAPAAAQKQGGTLKYYHRDNPPTTSIHEEATVSTAAMASRFSRMQKWQ